MIVATGWHQGAGGFGDTAERLVQELRPADAVRAEASTEVSRNPCGRSEL